MRDGLGATVGYSGENDGRNTTVLLERQEYQVDGRFGRWRKEKNNGETDKEMRVREESKGKQKEVGQTKDNMCGVVTYQ